MKLCLVNVVLMLIITGYKGMVDGMAVTTERFVTPLMESTRELSSTKCTNTYQVSHDREKPKNKKYEIGHIKDDAATFTPETCWDYCTEDAKCSSVRYMIRGDGARYCHKFNISVQELKDTRRDDEIKTNNNTWVTTYITYDKDCDSVCDNLSTLVGALQCLPIGHGDRATCQAIPGCCFTKVASLGEKFTMCIKPSGV